MEHIGKEIERLMRKLERQRAAVNGTQELIEALKRLQAQEPAKSR